MSTRSEVADKIRLEAPEGWEIHHVGLRLRGFTDPEKLVAIVVEQRGIAAARFSSDGVEIPVDVTLAVWVIVDAARGDSAEVIEDRLEEAAEELIRIFEPLGEAVWDGTAERTSYDEQKPAYQFTLRFTGTITQEEEI